MIHSAPTIQKGMEVYTRDGVRLGCVGTIWPYVPVSPQGEALSPGDLSQPEADSGCFEVEGNGTLAVGSRRWYVPLQAIEAVGPGDRVALASTQAECDKQYTQRPGFVDADIT